MARNPRKRRVTCLTLGQDTWERLEQLSAYTGLPVSRVVDVAVKDLHSKTEETENMYTSGNATGKKD